MSSLTLNIGRWAFVIFASVCTLWSCGRTEQAAVSGKIELRYAGVTEDGYLFTLTNASPQPIRLSAFTDHGRESPVWPARTRHDCRWSVPQESSTAVASGGGVEDGGPPPERIEVNSGRQLQVAYRGILIDELEGDVCRLTVTLADGSIIQSDEFKRNKR
jgi:hypothetical protein